MSIQTKIQKGKKNKQYSVSIPKSIIKMKKLKKGRVVYWDEDDEGFLKLMWKK